MAPIDHLACDDLGIGNDNPDILIGADGSAAGADGSHFSRAAANLDAITDLDWTLAEDDEATDEVLHNIAQAKTQPDAQCTSEDVERADLEA